jgi:DNA-binding phage protein
MTKPRAGARKLMPANAIETSNPLIEELFLLARDRGLSDTVLAKKLGYSRTTLYYARKGTRNLKFPFVLDFVTLLGLELTLIPKRKSQNGELFSTPSDAPRPGHNPGMGDPTRTYRRLVFSQVQPDD